MAQALAARLASSEDISADDVREDWDYIAHDVRKIEAYLGEGEVDG